VNVDKLHQQEFDAITLELLAETLAVRRHKVTSSRVNHILSEPDLERWPESFQWNQEICRIAKRDVSPAEGRIGNVSLCLATGRHIAAKTPQGSGETIRDAGNRPFAFRVVSAPFEHAKLADSEG
jgi:hypothetical protein